MALRVEELWVFPVKGLRGVQVDQAEVSSSGLALDRAFCVVDTEGTLVAKHEAVSKRKIPGLATIEVALGPELTLSAPGMRELVVPLDPGALPGPDGQVECSGRSTTSGGGWSLGFVPARHCGEAAAAWLTEYLNRPDGEKRVSGKSETTRFALMRAVGTLALRDYPPLFPFIEKAATSADYAQRLAFGEKRFADLAPLMIMNAGSGRAVTKAISAEHPGVEYPMSSFRGNVVVNAPAWDEETWKHLDLVCATRTVPLVKIKECPRCTVPCRDERTGKYLFPEPLLLWRALKRMFPRKAEDREWGSWAGVFFGVYYGPREPCPPTVLRVGDRLEVRKTEPWDAHLRASWAPAVALGLGLAAAVLAYRLRR